MDNISFDFNLVITQGDKRSVQMTFATDDEVPVAVDISSWDFFYTAKSSLALADVSAEIQLQPTDFAKTDSGSGTVDRITFEVDTGTVATGDLFQDLQKVVATVPTTLGVGVLVIETQVTIRVAAP